MLFSLFVFSFLFAVSTVKADCAGQYGQPCNSYSIVVDKMVQKPGTSDYVDNLSVSDPRYKPGEFVMFKVTIKNTSTTTFGGMTAKDYVPSYLTPVEGPGTFDSVNRVITFDAGAFAVDEQKTFYMKMQVDSQANLPADKGLFCVVNRAVASSNTTSDEDSSQLCIEKQIPSVKGVSTVVTVPATGPEFGLVFLAIDFIGLGIGLKMRKNSKKV